MKTRPKTCWVLLHQKESSQIQKLASIPHSAFPLKVACRVQIWKKKKHFFKIVIAKKNIILSLFKMIH